MVDDGRRSTGLIQNEQPFDWKFTNIVPSTSIVLTT